MNVKAGNRTSSSPSASSSTSGATEPTKPEMRARMADLMLEHSRLVMRETMHGS